MALDVAGIRGVIWDLDNTLYQFTEEFYKACTTAAAQAAQEMGINLSYEDTLRLAERSEKEYGYSMHGYVTDHGLSYASLHFPFHQKIDEKVIDKILGVKEGLQKLKLPQVILTNASRCWANRVLEYIEIKHLFPDEKIIPMEDVDFEPKSRTSKGFKKGCKILGLSPEDVLMVDDLDRNLLRANDLGMHTAYICYDDPMTELPDFIDAQFRNVLDVLKALKK